VGNGRGCKAANEHLTGGAYAEQAGAEGEGDGQAGQYQGGSRGQRIAYALYVHEAATEEVGIAFYRV